MILASIPSPPAEWQSFNIGQILRDLGLNWFSLDLTIHTYALCIILGIVVGLFVTNRRLVSIGVEPWAIIDVILITVPLGIIGGRAYHVLTHPADYFAGQDPVKVLYVWEGGMAIFGAMLFGTVGAWLGAKITKIRFTAILDAIAPAMLIAQAFGRVGNYFNHELYGAPTDLPWGLEIESTNPAYPVGLPAGTLFHPTFIYEGLWNLLGAVLLIVLGKRLALQWGRLFALYLVWYGIGRAFIENIRLDPSEIILGARVNAWAALLVVLIGLVIFYIQGKRHPGILKNPYTDGRPRFGDSSLESKLKYTVDELIDVKSAGSKRT